MLETYKNFLIFTRATSWQDWTLAAQADTVPAMLAAVEAQRLYLDDEAEVLVAQPCDVEALTGRLVTMDEVEVETWPTSETRSSSSAQASSSAT